VAAEAGFANFLEINSAGLGGENCKVFADPGARPGGFDEAALAYDYGPGFNFLAAIGFDAQPLAG
jgi:hypothetical protein